MIALMNNIFLLQLLASFIVGGALITFVSLLAEKAPKKWSGIIMTFPTTAAIAFFFMGGVTISPAEAAAIAPSVLIPLGLSMLFAVCYPYAAMLIERQIRSKKLQVVMTLLLIILPWFGFSLIVVLNKFNNLPINLTISLLIIGLSFFITRFSKYERSVPLQYTLQQKVWRAIIVGFVIMLVVLFSKLLNPFWGGMLTMFPAAFCSMLTIFQWKYSAKELFPIVYKIPLGAFSMMAFVLGIMYSFPKHGAIVGLIVAYLCSLATTLLLLKVQK
jgi:MFS family permease